MTLRCYIKPAYPVRIIFAGTPEFILPVLHAVISSKHDIAAILTQPDRPAGRGLKQRQSPVKQEALTHGLLVMQPETYTPQTIDDIAALQADLMITMSYGMLLPDEILASLPIGCVNIHTSLLPRWRGAAPIARAIEAGDTETGISLMRTVLELDAGPVINQYQCSINEDDTTHSMERKLAALGAEKIADLLNHNDDDIHELITQACTQPETDITYAPKLEKQEAWIDWNDSAQHIACKIRAHNPWPIAQTHLDKRVLRIWSARACDNDMETDIETARLKTTKRKVYAGCGDGALELLQVQLAGGKPMPAAALANGYDIDGASLE